MNGDTEPGVFGTGEAVVVFGDHGEEGVRDFSFVGRVWGGVGYFLGVELFVSILVSVWGGK